MSRTRLALIGTTLVAALALAGCGTELTVSSDEIQTQISDQFAQQGINIETITCEEVDGEVGAPITCTATDDQGQEGQIEGEITAVDEENETVEFDVEIVSVQ
jgi:acetolactate synthase small subunit